MTIRLAQSETENNDIQLVYNLSNDADVRKNSFSHHTISWAEHQSWYSKMLTDSDILLFLIFENANFIGQVRFDRKEDVKSPIINISISKEYRGKGFASGCLKLALDELKILWPSTIKIIAHVLYENKASNLFFSRNKFELVKEDQHNTYEKVII